MAGLSTNGSVIIGPFVRLARTHALHAVGDATYAVALVGSIFALDTDAARGRILLYLLLTLAPFALVGPFIGPALDRIRGGRRLMIMLTLAARALIMVLLVRNIESFFLFPLAFTQLVMGKTYSVAKAATVPTTVTTDEELVEKNARLAIVGTVVGAVGAAPALGLQALFGSTPTLVYGFVIYGLGVVAASRLPRVSVEDDDVSADDIDLRSGGVRLAALAMSMMRAIVGFVFWLMVFAFGSNDIDTAGIGKAAGLAVRFALGFSIEGDNSQPAWKLGFVLASIGLGVFVGNVLAPRLRQRLTEEYMIAGALAAILLSAIATIWAGGLSGAVLLALVAGAAPAVAKLAFDSLVQRDAPGGNHGAAFGRFETRFQVASVIGSVVAVAPTVIIPIRVGAFVVALAALVAAAAYVVGSRALRAGQPIPWTGMFTRLRERNDEPDPGADDTVEPSPRPPSGGPDSGASGSGGGSTGQERRAEASPSEQEPVPGPTDQVDPVQPFDPDEQLEPTPPEPSSRVSVDPYGEAFSDQEIQAADWASDLFAKSGVEPSDSPSWLAGYEGPDQVDEVVDDLEVPGFLSPKRRSRPKPQSAKQRNQQEGDSDDALPAPGGDSDL